ncbi:reverse transcriptase [Penicillium alfredii]|uniref:Reverse transcriptase n=1 Tax=Penicillium alfredii TaxID=1506179 RepID=A0A9W9KN69_9EURO|nr:reverse transcriptase [Penicillium alfredii]KAJ5111721.1 reverse transcriptase [Penicillium alfredii]
MRCGIIKTVRNSGATELNGPVLEGTSRQQAQYRPHTPPEPSRQSGGGGRRYIKNIGNEITQRGVITAVKWPKPDNASGLGGVPNRVLQALMPDGQGGQPETQPLASLLTILFNQYLRVDHCLPHFREATTTVLRKPDKDDYGEYEATNYGLLLDSSFGGRRGRGTGLACSYRRRTKPGREKPHKIEGGSSKGPEKDDDSKDPDWQERRPGIRHGGRDVYPGNHAPSGTGTTTINPHLPTNLFSQPPSTLNKVESSQPTCQPCYSASSSMSTSAATNTSNMSRRALRDASKPSIPSVTPIWGFSVAYRRHIYNACIAAIMTYYEAA